MNKSRHSLTSQDRKKVNKQVKKGQQELTQLKTEEPTTPQAILKRYPPKARKSKQALVDSIVKTMQIKKNKRIKQSKRTTPGEPLTKEATPAHAHVENERWKKTVDKQNQLQRKILTSKLQKNKKI